MTLCIQIQNLRAFVLLEMSSPIGLTLSPLLRLASFQTRNLSVQHGFLRQKSTAIRKQPNVSILSLFNE